VQVEPDLLLISHKSVAATEKSAVFVTGAELVSPVISAATNALNEGAAEAPDVGPAKTVFAEAVATPVPPLATGRIPET